MLFGLCLLPWPSSDIIRWTEWFKTVNGLLTGLLLTITCYMLGKGFLALVWRVLPLLSCHPPPRPPIELVGGRVGGDGSLVVWVPPLVVVTGVCAPTGRLLWPIYA